MRSQLKVLLPIPNQNKRGPVVWMRIRRLRINLEFRQVRGLVFFLNDGARSQHLARHLQLTAQEFYLRLAQGFDLGDIGLGAYFHSPCKTNAAQ